MVKQYLEIGKIVGTHGVKGEIRVQPWCDSPDFMSGFKTLYLDREGKHPVRVLSCRPQSTIVLLSLEGTQSVEQASLLRGRVLYMNRSEAKIEKGSWFVQDLIDCTVIDADDESKTYGVLCEVSVTGANDVWHIKTTGGKERLIPAIPPVVISVDVENGIIRIRPLKGLFEDED